MGFSGREYDSYVAEKDYISDASITIRNPNGDIAEVITDPNDPRLQELIIRRTYPSWYVDITRHVKKLVIGEGITDIGHSAFSSSFDSLEKVVLPSTLKTIGDCSLVNDSLKSIVIPASVGFCIVSSWTVTAMPKSLSRVKILISLRMEMVTSVG